jgi:hypothetical protein
LLTFPQVYFGDFRLPPATALQQSLAAYAEYDIPVAPICQAYSDPAVNYVANATDVLAFVTAAKAAGVPGVSFFSTQDMTLALFGALQSISF